MLDPSALDEELDRIVIDALQKKTATLSVVYRVYYAQESETIVLLLSGGSKRTQAADIQDAVEYWRDYQRRKK
jgi:putative addiction module killer protein